MGYSESIKSIGLSEAIKLHFFGCAVGSLVDHRMNRMIYTSLPCVSLPGQPQGGQEGLARPSAGGGRAGQWRCVKERPLQCSPEVRKSGSPEVQTCQTKRICEGRSAHDEKARPLTTSGPPDFQTVLVADSAANATPLPCRGSMPTTSSWRWIQSSWLWPDTPWRTAHRSNERGSCGTISTGSKSSPIA